MFDFIAGFATGLFAAGCAYFVGWLYEKIEAKIYKVRLKKYAAWVAYAKRRKLPIEIKNNQIVRWSK